jgi:hypothetical protein
MGEASKDTDVAKSFQPYIVMCKDREKRTRSCSLLLSGIPKSGPECCTRSSAPRELQPLGAPVDRQKKGDEK